MKALTVREPWATAIVFGPKRLENRSWHPPKTFLGTRIAIHAGAQFTTKDRDAVQVVLGRLRSERLHSMESSTAHPQAVERMLMIRDVTPSMATPERGFGCVIGVATVVEFIGGVHRAHELGQERWFTGPMAWVLDDVRGFRAPIAVPGRQRLWTLPSLITSQIERQLEGQAT